MNKTGKIKYIVAPVQVSQTFKKAEIVIETEEQYPQVVKFELHGVHCDLLNGKSIGQRVNVTFDVKGREWVNPQGVTSIFNTLVAFNVNPI